MGKQNRNQEVRRIRRIAEQTVDQDAAQEEIRALAYQLFCECGCEQGHDLVHWLEAERTVLERLKAE
jgi:hypothetical protein